MIDSFAEAASAQAAEAAVSTPSPAIVPVALDFGEIPGDDLDASARCAHDARGMKGVVEESPSP